MPNFEASQSDEHKDDRYNSIHHRIRMYMDYALSCGRQPASLQFSNVLDDGS